MQEAARGGVRKDAGKKAGAGAPPGLHLTVGGWTGERPGRGAGSRTEPGKGLQLQGRGSVPWGVLDQKERADTRRGEGRGQRPDSSSVASARICPGQGASLDSWGLFQGNQGRADDSGLPGLLGWE